MKAMEYLIIRNNKATPKRTWEYITVAALRQPSVGQSALLGGICDSYEFVSYDNLERLKKELKESNRDNDYVFSVNGDNPALLLVP